MYVYLTLNAPLTKTVAFTNSVDPDEVAQYERPHKDLDCSFSSLLILS